MSPSPSISKAAEEESNLTTKTSPPSGPQLKDEVPKSTPTPTEYEAGRVICDTCGRGVSFRDELTGSFSVKHWDDHRLTCAAVGGPPLSSAVGQPPTVIFAEDVHSPCINSPEKRRRAKRTEEERIEYLRGDPRSASVLIQPIAQFHGMLIARAVSRRNIGKNVYTLGEHNALFSKDPAIQKFDAERVLCATCDKWIPIKPDDHRSAVQIWLQHRSVCNKNSGPSPLRILTTTPQLFAPGPSLIQSLEGAIIDAVNAPMFSHNTVTTIHQHNHFSDETQYHAFMGNEWQSTHGMINEQFPADSEDDARNFEDDTDNISLYSSEDEPVI
ncbi:hypothetical protein C8J56DRAFT_1058127 [Mycena floridula]|nr:hypothetical protein C8J56DRAFT_1058127 [Mycena floridula]